MKFIDFIFYCFSFILLFSALRVITARNPIYSALFLVLAFFNAAGIWLLLQAEFLAIALVLVYVGAVMVLFLFVVMMLDINLDQLRKGFWEYLPIASFVAVIMFVEIILVLNHSYFNTKAQFIASDVSNTELIGKVLYSDYVLPFEVASIILLVAIIAAIALTLRGKKTHKAIDPADQVSVQKKDRLRMVKMNSSSMKKTNIRSRKK